MNMKCFFRAAVVIAVPLAVSSGFFHGGF